MVQIFLLFIFLTNTIVKAADSTFIINGKLDGRKSGIINLYIYADEQTKLTSKIVDGVFTFKGTITKTFAGHACYER